MRRPRLDLRLRVAAVLAAVCIAVVGCLGIILYVASNTMQEDLVEQVVAEEMEVLMARSRAARGPVASGGPNLQYYVLRAPEDEGQLPPALRSLGPGHYEIGRGREELHVIVREDDSTRYIVAYDSGQHDLREARFRNLLLLAVGTAAMFALVLGYWLAGVLTRQLRELASRISTFAPDAPYAPLERPEHDVEVAALAHALDQYHERFAMMIRREQEFTANTSHELRTPLTGIRTSCELLLADPALADQARTRIERIDRAARQMTERIEALLLLARPHSPEELQLVNLRRCAEDAVEPYRDEIARKGLVFSLDIGENEIVRADRKAFQLVLANLIKNAVCYTDHGHVRVSYDGRRVTVSDSGAGVAPEDLPQLFERYFRAGQQSDGLGLGLAIVRRICDDLGWRIEVQSEAGSGSAFSVVFD